MYFKWKKNINVNSASYWTMKNEVKDFNSFEIMTEWQKT